MLNVNSPFEKLQKIYQERDEEYTRWEAEYQRRREYLNKFQSEVEKQKEENESVKEDLIRKEKELDSLKNELQTREGRLAENYVLLESARNEMMKKGRELEKQSSMNSITGQEELMAMLEEYKAQVNTLSEENLTLRNQVSSLTAERLELLKQNLELESRIKTEIMPKKQAPTEQTFQEVEEEPEQQDELKEELTASTLRNYLLKHKQYEDVEILHSDQGEQVHMKYAGLKCAFLFGQPGTFDVIGEEKQLNRKQEILLKSKHEELEISRDGHETCVTGYFMPDTDPEFLMRQIDEISTYYR